MAKRVIRSYVCEKDCDVQEMCKNRLDYSDPSPRGQRNIRRFLESFPTFMQAIADGKEFTTEELESLPYFDYLVTRLNKADRTPVLRSKGRRHVINLMRDAIKLFHDVKNYGLKSPLEFFRHSNGRRLCLVRGGRRLVILNILGVKKVAGKVYRSYSLFKRLSPKIGWYQGNPDLNSIEGVAIKQFIQLGIKATDKYRVHGYMPLYDREIGYFRNKKKFKLLEIGVRTGVSLQLWQEAFPKGAIYGIDKSKINLQGFNIFVGRQEDSDFLNREVSPAGPFDVVIDDGSHRPKDQLTSFKTLWPHVNHGGVYVIEDLHHNFSGKSGVMADYLKKMVDDIYIDPTVTSINFYYNIVFVRKI